MLGTDDEEHYLECQRAAAYIERLEAKLTQDPKDARCQLYKATQKWQQEAERCNAEIERLHNICEYARNEIKDQKKEIERLEEDLSLALDQRDWNNAQCEQLEAEKEDFRQGYIKVGCDDSKLRAKIEQLETAIKQATEYGEVSFLGVNIPFENFKLLKKALENNDE
jgi:predicted  nucleic acid-binding Zn-ribbon protein